MTTTDHLPHPDDVARVGEERRARIRTLDGIRRRKRLHALEATRSHLATMAAQQRSHGLDDAEESFGLQCSVELTIRDEFPDEYEDLFPTWLETDLVAEHPRGVLTADCGICRSIATAHGLNIIPPEAA